MGTERIKKLIIRITPVKLLKIYQEPIKKYYVRKDPFSTLSYSQEGEDLILRRIFEGKKDGFYVDVGAHHPKRFSNTYLFYEMGWRGINIDATPGSMKEFDRLRPKDVNLEKAISDKKQFADYFIFNEPALNTFSIEEAKKKNGSGGYEIIEKLRIETFRLSEILEDYLKPGQKIDFLNIDVEGLDFQVLKSLNWSNQKPHVILIESLGFDFKTIHSNELYQFLIEKSYSLVAKTFNTLIFIRKK